MNLLGEAAGVAEVILEYEGDIDIQPKKGTGMTLFQLRVKNK